MLFGKAPPPERATLFSLAEVLREVLSWSAWLFLTIAAGQRLRRWSPHRPQLPEQKRPAGRGQAPHPVSAALSCVKHRKQGGQGLLRAQGERSHRTTRHMLSTSRLLLWLRPQWLIQLPLPCYVLPTLPGRESVASTVCSGNIRKLAKGLNQSGREGRAAGDRWLVTGWPTISVRPLSGRGSLLHTEAVPLGEVQVAWPPRTVFFSSPWSRRAGTATE